jgi:hypothetical protein
MATGNVTLEMDEALLTIFLRLGLAQAQKQLPFQVKQVAATISGEGLELVAGLARISLQPDIDAAGKIDLRIKTAKLAGFALPTMLHGLLNAIVNERVNALLSGLVTQGLRPRLLSVRTRTGALVVVAALSEVVTVDADG